MQKTICVFCSSSDAVAPTFFETATELGTLIAGRNYTLVYGGVRVGLMGALARAVHQNGGRVIGVIPGSIRDKGITYETADELVVTRDLRERKAVMEARSDAFVGLPGGFGTLEEILEILTLKQLGLHAKPVVLVNTLGFYDHLVRFFEHIYRERFARPDYRQLYHIAPEAAGVFSYLETYRPVQLQSKWF
jgi:uncharacterized protein (TIGR00730 family)